MTDWGWAVQWCRWFDGTGDFCKFCAIMSRAWHIYILHRNPTFIGIDLPLYKDEDEVNL